MEDQLVQEADAVAPDTTAGLVNEVRAALAEVRDELRAANASAAARERLVERLHEENQRLRAGERQLVLRPVLVDLQRLRNELLREAAGSGTEAAAELLVSFARSVEQALERGGIQVVRPAIGGAFDPAQHRVVDVLQAGEGEDGTVAEVVSDGYQDVVAGRMLAPAGVVVCRRTAQPPAPPTPG
ncbi:MAG TPA: nucleotide exchange factor GrpE [Micromonosporaceae bacterium]|nr:nucleotide exchange factor GrpE [Micromonosporaceae bacterium]